MNTFPPINLACDRFSLRLLETRDAADLLAIFGDPEVVRYWSQPPWLSEEEALAMLERDRQAFVDGQALRLGIVLRSTGHVVGTLSVFNLSPANRRAEIGYALARAHWGQGLMHEALGLLVEWAFDTLQLHRLEADIDPANEGVGAQPAAAGFSARGAAA